ncbi:MAG: amidohydrolase family protein, partial [Proteobacteria bacterium]|nr:amidohydrolase family protein [Pseudomonadota bacterium]
ISSELKRVAQALSGDAGHVFQFIADWEDAEDEFSILRDTAARTGAKGTFTLLDSGGKPNLWREQLDRIEKAQADGLDIRGQVLSRPVGIMMGHPASMSPFYDRPSFKALNSLPWDEKISALRDPETKTRILNESNENPHIFIKLVGNKFKSMYVLDEPIEYLPSPDRCISNLAAAENRDAEEWLYDYLLTNNGNALIYIPGANLGGHIPEMLDHPFTVVALGDGGAHVGSICDASANLYVLTRWVREQGRFTLEQGIHMLTRQPAELYSLKDRGVLAKGMKADINIIDFENLKLHTPHIVYDLPAGGKRFLQHADGIRTTIVAGEVIYQDGVATGALPGKLIRGQRLDPRT